METRRTLRRQRDEARDARDRAIDQRDEAHAELASRQWVTTHLTSSHDDLAIIRTRERDDAIRALRATEDQLAAVRRLLAERPATAAELRDTRRALMLSERARASLAEQLATVQVANDSMCRAAVDRAGTLDREMTR